MRIGRLGLLGAFLRTESGIDGKDASGKVIDGAAESVAGVAAVTAFSTEGLAAVAAVGSGSEARAPRRTPKRRAGVAAGTAIGLVVCPVYRGAGERRDAGAGQSAAVAVAAGAAGTAVGSRGEATISARARGAGAIAPVAAKSLSAPAPPSPPAPAVGLIAGEKTRGGRPRVLGCLDREHGPAKIRNATAGSGATDASCSRGLVSAKPPSPPAFGDEPVPPELPKPKPAAPLLPPRPPLAWLAAKLRGAVLVNVALKLFKRPPPTPESAVPPVPPGSPKPPAPSPPLATARGVAAVPRFTIAASAATSAGAALGHIGGEARRAAAHGDSARVEHAAAEPGAGGPARAAARPGRHRQPGSAAAVISADSSEADGAEPPKPPLPPLARFAAKLTDEIEILCRPH